MPLEMSVPPVDGLALTMESISDEVDLPETLDPIVTTSADGFEPRTNYLVWAVGVAAFILAAVLLRPGASSVSGHADAAPAATIPAATAPPEDTPPPVPQPVSDAGSPVSDAGSPVVEAVKAIPDAAPLPTKPAKKRRKPRSARKLCGPLVKETYNEALCIFEKKTTRVCKSRNWWLKKKLKPPPRR